MDNDDYEAQRMDWRSLFVWHPDKHLMRAIHLPRHEVIATCKLRRANYRNYMKPHRVIPWSRAQEMLAKLEDKD